MKAKLLGVAVTIVVIGTAVYGLITWKELQSQRQEAVCTLARQHLKDLEVQARALGAGMSVEAYAATSESLLSELPGLAARLAGVTVPTEFLHGAKSPMPVTASTDSADAIGEAAHVQVVDGAGHFVWHERPGCVRAALDRLVSERLSRDL